MRFSARLLAASLLAFLPFTSFAADPTLEITIAGKTSQWHLSDLKSKVKTATVTIDDPNYNRKIAYDAFAFADVLALAGEKIGDDGSKTLVLHCKDGYAPTMDASILQENQGYIAFEEHGKKTFPRFRHGKEMITAAPFYLVWSGANSDQFQWPYQLVKIEVSSGSAYDGIAPKNVAKDSSQYKGFTLFKNQCVRCHSMNLIGGDVGPELNIPKNITEYWDKATLKAFIHDVSSFRAKDKMPPFKNLSDEDLHDIVDYLELMKSCKKS